MLDRQPVAHARGIAFVDQLLVGGEKGGIDARHISRDPPRFGQQVFGRIVLRHYRSCTQRRTHCGAENQTEACHKSYQMHPAPL